MLMLIPLALLVTAPQAGSQASSAAPAPGVGEVPQGTQTDAAYAASFAANHVTNAVVTTQQTSCYTPEVPYTVNNGPNDGYSGQTPCLGASTTGEDLGPYPTQAGSNSGYPAATPMLVKDYSESDVRVNPTNPALLIGSSKWFVSAEGYNHLLGFYESFDGGESYPNLAKLGVTCHWTDLGEPESFKGDACYNGVETVARDGATEIKNQHSDIHNLYDLLWNRSIWEGYIAHRGTANDLGITNSRPFVLSRSGAAGIQT